MTAENGAEPAEECRNPPNHLPQAACRESRHTHATQPTGRGERWHRALHSGHTARGQSPFSDCFNTPPQIINTKILCERVEVFISPAIESSLFFRTRARSLIGKPKRFL